MPARGGAPLSGKTKPLPPQADIMPPHAPPFGARHIADCGAAGFARPQPRRSRARLVGFCDAGARARPIWLLVITGKGTRGEGKLRRALPDWLARGALAGLVVEYGPAAANHGGAGAYYLRLRRGRQRLEGGRSKALKSPRILLEGAGWQ